MSNKQEVEELVRRLHRAMAELGDGATDAEWNVLRQKVASALSSVRDMEESDARWKWDEADKALSAELARLDLTVLEATTFEGDGLEDGNYIIMLRYDDVVSVRRTLAGLEPKGHDLRVSYPEYLLSDGRVAVVWGDGYLHVWSSMEEYKSVGHDLDRTEPDEIVEPMDWGDILCEPMAMVDAHREALEAKRAREQSPCGESPVLPVYRVLGPAPAYEETFKRSILLQTEALAEDIQHDLDCWATNLRGLYDDESIAKMTQLDTTLFRVDFWFQPPRGPRALGQTDQEFIQGLFFDDPTPNHLATFTIIEEK
jgi:hypothetical protein